MATNGRATMNDFLKEIRPMVVFITDVSFVIESMSFTEQSTLVKLIETGAKQAFILSSGLSMVH